MRAVWILGAFLGCSACVAETSNEGGAPFMEGNPVSEAEYCPSTFSYEEAKKLASGDCLEMTYGKEYKKGFFCAHPLDLFKANVPGEWKILTKNSFHPRPVAATYGGENDLWKGAYYCKFTYLTKITKTEKSLYLRRVEWHENAVGKSPARG